MKKELIRRCNSINTRGSPSQDSYIYDDFALKAPIENLRNFLTVQVFPFLKIVMDASWKGPDVGPNLIVSVQSQNFGMMGSGRGAPEAKQDRLGEYWNEEMIRQIEQENEQLRKQLKIQVRG